MRLCRVAWFLLAPLSLGGCAERQFPEWRVLPLTLEGAWESAPAVVIGDVRSVAPLGVQEIKVTPRFVSPSIKHIYWCEGEFRAHSAVKGRLPRTGKKYIWASVRPGCDLYRYAPPRDERPITRAWFIREEGDYVRPVADGGSFYFVTFYANWEPSSDIDPQARFARLLLTPSARDTSLRDFATGFESGASTACFILGRERCVELIRPLAALGDPELRRAACDFLRLQYQEGCAR